MLRRYAFRVDPELLDALSGCLFEAGAEGLEEGPDVLTTYAEEALGQLLAAAYDEFRQRVAAVFPNHGTFPLEVDEVSAPYDQAWLDALGPVVLLDGVIFCPIQRRADVPPDQQVLWYEPKVAFGSGDHPTTRLAARSLARLIDEARVGGEPIAQLLDVGTGSGVLALLALHLGVLRAIGTDISKVAIDAARQNAELNQFAERLGLYEQTLPPEPGNYRLIVANIDRATLLGLTGPLAGRLAPSGTLVVTGFLLDDLEELREAARAQGLTERRLASEGDWALLELGW